MGPGLALGLMGALGGADLGVGMALGRARLGGRGALGRGASLRVGGSALFGEGVALQSARLGGYSDVALGGAGLGGGGKGGDGNVGGGGALSRRARLVGGAGGSLCHADLDHEFLGWLLSTHLKSMGLDDDTPLVAHVF